jgi:uncharacterized Tic20 family protein
MVDNNLMKIDDERKVRNWGMLCHLTALAGFIGLPFGHLLGPLIIWLLKKMIIPL